jgi:ABC-2 type transport system ATP-binding protein
VPSLGVVEAVLELTDLVKIQDKIVATMSKGMKQRLQLGRVLLHDPKILILDEPASDLDPRARIEIRDLLLELRSLGKTILLSSHILSELSDVCTSIGILERGRLVVAGPIGEIAQRLEVMRAAEEVGHTHGPMNPLPPSQPASPASLQSAPVPARPRRVKIRVLGDPDAAAAQIRGGPGVVEVSIVAGVVHVGYLGHDTRIAELVARLVHVGVGVVGVEPERNELERIFLEVTKGEVQ